MAPVYIEGKRASFLDVARMLEAARFWKRGHAKFLRHQISARDEDAARNLTGGDHMRAAATWLARAQDAMPDGGVCGRYHLLRGWTSSYPETTGYIIPTFLSLARELDDDSFFERAERAVQFLLGLQLPDGGFPGLEVAMNLTEPSPFNSAQILHGLVAWHRHSGSERALNAACRAGDWLLSMQDDDGAWRKHFYNKVAAAYSAHLSCWLAELGSHTGEQRYLDGAARHLDWTLAHRDGKTGWIDLSGFDEKQHRERISFTHTIAYTLWGILYSSEILDRAEGIEAVTQAAEGIARRLELSGRLPGILDHEWQPREESVCLTGNAQMALIWFRLFGRGGDKRFLDAAVSALDHIKRTQPMENPNPRIEGGIPGSWPVWGSYIHLAIPNWAAKFFIDALIAKRQVLEMAEPRPQAG